MPMNDLSFRNTHDQLSVLELFGAYQGLHHG